MRKISEEMKKLVNSLSVEKKDGDRITQIRKYKLITPLFGGGVRPRENDVSKLIRETSVRGQLRFWWRAMRGTGTITDMKKCEDEIFGSGGEHASQSKVLIVVKEIKSGTEEFIYNPNDRDKPFKNWESIAYAAFALQPTNEDKKLKAIRIGVEFILKLSFPSELKDDVEAALWAWETFGGIGGRTRRGFGALALMEIDGVKAQHPKVSEIEGNIKEKLIKCISSPDANTPHLTAQTVFKIKRANDAEKAWQDAVEKLRKFRQFRRDKETHNESPYGKSQWSEPNAIRFIEGRRKGETLTAFPRAEFGLPIIFHFPPQHEKPTLEDFTLNLKDKERMTSPLILRPIQCADGAVSLALILNTQRAKDLTLEITSGNRIRKVVSAKLETDEARKLTNDGLTPLKNNTEVLQAFLDFFAQ